MTMQKMSNKYKLIPELRFPEFVKEGEWYSTPLDDLCELITKGTTPTTLGYNFTESGINFIKIESILEGKINLDKATFISIECNQALKRSQLKEDDILFSIAGALGVVTTVSKEILPANINQALSIVRLKNTKQKDYVQAFLKSNIIASEVQKIKAGAPQPNISLNQVANFSIQIPKNQQEQQKISSCLSSLDELLTAHTDKLENLKTYKKGLMQNLFPQEGEKVPKLRFKEFEKDGEWIEDKLGNIGNPSMCKRIFKEETTSDSKNGIPFYKIGTFGKEADSYISKEIYKEYKTKYSFPKKGDILISASGTIGRLVVYDGKPAFFQDSNIVWINNDESKTLNNFLFYAYSLLNWQTSDGGIIQRLYNADLKGMIICYPKKPVEQQKIADTLSSLDNLIKEQTNKIEQLKLHKKGLMQGLFPKVNN